MYYHCVNHADEIEKVVYDQNAGTIIVPEDEISAIAGAFFLEFSKLPELPKKDMMSYDEKSKNYVFMDSDRGESGSEIGATAGRYPFTIVTAEPEEIG